MPATLPLPRIWLLTLSTLVLVPLLVADEPAPRRNQSQFEIKFLKNMIDHHNMAVMMAQLCEERAIHPELESMCEDIATAQAAEILEMQEWLSDWYGITYETQMSKQMQRQLDALATLHGRRFEIVFMSMMINHHEKAVREGHECLRKAYHDDLIDLCEGIVTTQTMEISQLEAWLHTWYGICDR